MPGAHETDTPQKQTRRRMQAGKLTVLFPASVGSSTGNLTPPLHLLELLGALSDPRNDKDYPQYKSIAGLGYVGGAGLLLGTLLGFHLLGLFLSLFHFHSLWMSRWCLYVVSLMSFHALEFLVTARYNPRTATAESYLITHSKAYTIAAVASWVWVAAPASSCPSASRALLH